MPRRVGGDPDLGVAAVVAGAKHVIGFQQRGLPRQHGRLRIPVILRRVGDADARHVDLIELPFDVALKCGARDRLVRRQRWQFKPQQGPVTCNPRVRSRPLTGEKVVSSLAGPARRIVAGLEVDRLGRRHPHDAQRRKSSRRPRQDARVVGALATAVRIDGDRQQRTVFVSIERQRHLVLFRAGRQPLEAAECNMQAVGIL